MSHAGHLYRKTPNGAHYKRYWIYLIGQEFMMYKKESDSEAKSVHTLKNVFLREEEPIPYEAIALFSFSIVSAKKTRTYYVTRKEEYDQWIAVLRAMIGKADVEDEYTLVSGLGKGKYSSVFRGVHNATGDSVAIKVIEKAQLQEEELEMLHNEIEILKLSQHPHIIELLDIFENEEHLQLVLSYMEGGDLFDYQKNRLFCLPDRLASSIAHKLAAAIYYLHSFGITHRDLKPENILMSDLTADANLKLADFGLSKALGPNEKANEFFGTLVSPSAANPQSYASPEVLMNMHYGKEVDLWGIGVIVFSLVCGILPFDGKNEEQTALNIVNCKARWDSPHAEDVSADARDLIESTISVVTLVELLKVNPTERLPIEQVLLHPWITKYCPEVMSKRQIVLASVRTRPALPHVGT